MPARRDLCTTLLLSAALFVAPSASAGSLPLDEIGARVSKGHAGDALIVESIPGGARLRSAFQKLEGEATREGLWVTSTAAEGGRLRLSAAGIGRSDAAVRLAASGDVTIEGNVVRYARPGLTEEYGTGIDGLRQDFVVAQRPEGSGELRVELALRGARARHDHRGITLAFDASGRALLYGRLQVSDAAGRPLAASMDAIAPDRLLVRVQDDEAAYPVRIDPTFSDANWTSLNAGIPGANGAVLAACADAGGNVYVAGDFTLLGSVAANRIAKWNGSAWSALGTGLDGSVRALAMVGADLYAGGTFHSAGGVTANFVARWNGSAWAALTGGLEPAPDGQVNALVASGSDLYVGGFFGGGNISRWDGGAWQGVTVVTGGAVNTLAAIGPDVYAGGTFTSAGGVPGTGRLAKWDGATWSAVGGGISSSSVTSLAASGTDLHVGGTITSAGPTPVSNIAKWDGASWSALGSGVNAPPSAMTSIGSDLFVSGNISSAGGVGVNGIARWDGAAWSAPGAGVSGGAPRALAVSGGQLHVVGEFTAAAGVPALRLAKWDGSAWSPLASGMDGPVKAVAVLGSDLYVGGNFTSVGGIAASRIAKWNGSTWSPLGTGMNGNVTALQTIGSDLYAGGLFTTAGGVMVNGVAKWSAGNWSALGTGMQSPIVTALAAIGGDLYAGGNFTSAGGVSANRVAKWNGSTWSPLGSGAAGLVLSLAASGSDVYAGGTFASAGGAPGTLRIAKWDGMAWSALGTGASNQVNALLLVGSDLYAGGQFLGMSGVPGTQFIARWDGAAWSDLGTGMGGPTHALAYSGGELYAGGDFTIAGGVPVRRIAKWDGSAWSAEGEGPDDSVYAIARDASGHLFAGGAFSFAGAATSPFVAQANLFYLEGLELTGGSLSPAFVDTTLAYSASVPNGVSSTTLFPTAAQGNATITVNGSPVASGGASAPIALPVGTTPVNVVLTAADGVSTRTYTLAVTRAPAASNDASLAGLAPSAGILAPAFAPGTTSYAISVPFGVASLTLTPTAAQANATLRVNGVTVPSGSASGPIALGVGASGITTVVTAEDGIATRIYTVIVTRGAPSANADLGGLALGSGTLAPAFSAATTAYTAAVSDAVASITVTPTAADASAVLRVNGSVVASGSASGAIALAFGDNTVTVLVTAADGIATKTYTVVVTRDAGTTRPRLGNLSTRMQVLTGNDVMIGGFIIEGASQKTVVVRARGPSLTPFGITNALANPTLRLVRSSDQATLATNDDYATAVNLAQLQASGFAPGDALESAILIALPQGAYTAIVSGAGGGTGVGIVEVFEVDHPEMSLINISTRGQVLTGNDVMIGGFVISGTASKTVVVRARGPSLVPFGIPNALANPTLRLVRSSDQATVAVNDDWQGASNAADIAASGFAPANDLESAILVTLPPGAYTAIVSGVGGATGVGIVEVFDR